jgi:hexosaminidase
MAARPLLIIFALLASASAAVPAARRVERPTRADPSLRDYGNTEVWPLPAQAVSVCGGTLDPATFRIVAAQPAGDAFLLELARRFAPQILFDPDGAPSGAARVANLSLVVLDGGAAKQIQQGVDETYSLTFAKDCSSATITAATVFGARHGLETFSQLVNAQRPAGAYSVQGLDVADGPRFSFRGPLLDCARHWLPPNVLLNFFDALSFHKQNALIWGVGIDQAFVVQSAAFPNISATASFGPPGTHVYSRDMVSFLVREANFRGIRLIPYIELVGHDPLSMPGLQFCNGAPGGGLFHPLHADVWSFFDTFWADLREIFVEDYVQLGGDEVDLSCWSNDAEISAWNLANGHAAGDLTFVYALYMTRMMASMRKVGFLPIFYAEAFGPLNATGTFDFVGSKIVFNGWDTQTPGSLSTALVSGAKAIVTSYCFLMPGQTCPGFPQVNGDQPNWWYNYACELQNASLFSPEARPFLSNILGGGPARWSEDTDSTNLFSFTYPAVMGAAEKLWSPAILTNGSFYGTRQEVFADHRCVLLRRGVPVQPTSAYSWSCEFEFEPSMPPRTPLNPNPTNSSWAPPAASLGLPALSADTERDLRVRRMHRALNNAAGIGADGNGNATRARPKKRGGAASANGGAGADTSSRTAAAPPRVAAGDSAYMSIWPIPASFAVVPCGGAPEPAWHRVCSGCAAESADCPYLAHGDARSLAACQANCLGVDGCNAINYNGDEPDCVFRRCSNASAISTTPDAAYDVYSPLPPSFPVGLDEHFAIKLVGGASGDKFMAEVARRMLPHIMWHPSGAFDRPIKIGSLSVSVNDTGVRQIQASVDESYSLGFSADCTQAFVTAQTIFGARHGLETFSQMVQAERLSGSYAVASYFGLYNVTDVPRFDTRGLMVDSARHWLNPNLLLSLMDALSYVKMNKLEVGFGIDWAYTIESSLFPNLTDSSYGPRGTHQFSRDTIRALVREANLRGVRLVPFVEVVGHNALCSATPGICFCGGRPKGNLPHPLHADTWLFFDAYWAELKEIFPETYINIGGDEVDASCYVGDPEIEAWNIARGHGANETGCELPGASDPNPARPLRNTLTAYP